jgi:hypothetical protein
MIIAAAWIATYAWGWAARVPGGGMDTQAYTEFYWRETKELFGHFFKETQKLFQFSEKPISRPNVAELS